MFLELRDSRAFCACRTEWHPRRPMSGCVSAARRVGACNALAGGTRPGSTAQGRGSRHARRRCQPPVRSSRPWRRSSHRQHHSSHPWHRSRHPPPKGPSSSSRGSTGRLAPGRMGRWHQDLSGEEVARFARQQKLRAGRSAGDLDLAALSNDDTQHVASLCQARIIRLNNCVGPCLKKKAAATN